MYKYVLLATVLLLYQAISIAQKSGDPLWYNMGSKFYEEQHYEEAIYCFTKSIEIGAYTARSYAYRAGSKLNMGKLSMAITDMDTAFQVAPQDGYVCLFKGRLSLAKHDIDSCKYWCKKALLTDTANGQFNDQLAVTFAMQGNFDSAAFYEQKAIIAEPANTVYISNLAFSYQSLGNYKQALINFAHAIKLNPWEARDPGTLTNIAYCRYGMKAYTEALAICDTVVTNYPDYKYIYAVRGLTHCGLGHKEKGCADLTQFALIKETRQKATEYLKQCGCAVKP